MGDMKYVNLPLNETCAGMIKKKKKKNKLVSFYIVQK